MERENPRQIKPACRFGPGGDFVSVWPINELPARPPNALAALLDTIGEVMNAVLGSEYDHAAGLPLQVKSIAFPKEKMKYVSAKTSTKTTDAPAAPGAQGGRRVPAQPLLFADNSGTCPAAGNKQKHNIRAYRRVAKKRTPRSLPDQGSLFEADGKSAKTA